MKKRVSKEDLNKILINVDKYCVHNIETNVYLRTENRKGAIATKPFAPFQNLITMQIYNLSDFIGSYTRSVKSPNTFTNSETGNSLVLRMRINPKPTQTKHYLIAYENGKKPFYFSALWNTDTTAKKDKCVYAISDTNGSKGKAIIDLFQITIQPL